MESLDYIGNVFLFGPKTFGVLFPPNSKNVHVALKIDVCSLCGANISLQQCSNQVQIIWRDYMYPISKNIFVYKKYEQDK